MSDELIACMNELETKFELLAQKLIQLKESQSLYLGRNILPNDNAVSQKLMFDNISIRYEGKAIKSKDLMNYGFRVFSQNDEDGIILAIFALIGFKNKKALEIGSNCSNSEIGLPENCSANLAVNHNWHTTIIDIDKLACDQLTYFYARNMSSMHFHHISDEINAYYNPLIINKGVSPNNIESLCTDFGLEENIDLIIVDIDGEDFDVVKNIICFKPRVLVVEFEKRFGGNVSVYQKSRSDFNTEFSQSGTVSLLAWENFLKVHGYSLIAVNSTCFNAFFILDSENQGKIEVTTSKQIFVEHNAFCRVKSDFWLEPTESWSKF